MENEDGISGLPGWSQLVIIRGGNESPAIGTNRHAAPTLILSDRCFSARARSWEAARKVEMERGTGVGKVAANLAELPK